MNTETRSSGAKPDPALWEQPVMRRALAERDVAAVFTILRRTGISQRSLASLTGLAASEVYEVTRGRKVMSYDVLVRLADGLGVPRGYLGLAYDSDTAALLGASPVDPVLTGSSGTPESDEIRLFEYAAALTMGISTAASDQPWPASPDRSTPLPGHATAADVHQLEQITARLRAFDYQYGGGACRESVLAQSSWIRRLIQVPMTDDVRARLHLTLADLHNLAGWTSFDVGMHADARRHYALALTHAREAGDSSLLANVLYRIGRLHLHTRMITEALRFFQLGQMAAQEDGGHTTAALLFANEAWAHGMLGNAQQAWSCLGRAEDELARSDRTVDGPWVGFFGPTDLMALSGMTHLELNTVPGELEHARDLLARSVHLREPDMLRSKAFELVGLALAQTLDGDAAAGIVTGHEAVQLAGQLRSARIWDRLEPLAVALATVRQPDAADLRQQISGGAS